MTTIGLSKLHVHSARKTRWWPFPALSALGFVALAFPSTAAPPPLDARYAVSYGGVPVADARLTVGGTADEHRSVLRLRAVGLARMLTGFASRSVAEGGVAGGRPRPGTYRADTEKRDYHRTIRIVFAPATGDVASLVMRKRGEPQESEVPPALRRGVIDPLTAILRLRQALSEGDGGGSARVFDGRRRFDIRVATLGRGSYDLDGRAVPAVRLRIDFRPVAGFNERESSPAAEGGWIEALVSDDGRAVPLSFTTRGAVLRATIRLVAEEGVARRQDPAPDG